MLVQIFRRLRIALGLILFVLAIISIQRGSPMQLMSSRKPQQIRGAKFVTVPNEEDKQDEPGLIQSLLESIGLANPPPPPPPSARDKVVIRRGGSTAPRLELPD